MRNVLQRRERRVRQSLADALGHVRAGDRVEHSPDEGQRHVGRFEYLRPALGVLAAVLDVADQEVRVPLSVVQVEALPDPGGVGSRVVPLRECRREAATNEVSAEDIARSAGVTSGPVHHYFGGRKEGYMRGLERPAPGREEDLPPFVKPQRAHADRRACASRRDRAGPLDLAGTIADGEESRDHDARRVGPISCAAPPRPGRGSRTPRSPTTRAAALDALECWSRTQPRRQRRWRAARPPARRLARVAAPRRSSTPCAPSWRPTQATPASTPNARDHDRRVHARQRRPAGRDPRAVCGHRPAAHGAADGTLD